MVVSIDKFWIEGVLTDAHPEFLEKNGIDLDRNGAIEGKEVFGDLDGDGTVGDSDDYKIYLKNNRFLLQANIPFFYWGKALSVDNRIHQLMYLESDLYSGTQIQSAYQFIADRVADVKEWKGKQEKWICKPEYTPQIESRVYYKMMSRAGIEFDDQDDSSLVGNLIINEALDCDTSSFVAMAIGDEVGLRLQPVRTTEHIFLRGKDDNGREFNIDQGWPTSNGSYDVDQNLVDSGVYLVTLDDRQLNGLFLENRGTVLAERGRYLKSIAAYDEAIKIDPNVPQTNHNRDAAYKRFLLKVGEKALTRGALLFLIEDFF